MDILDINGTRKNRLKYPIIYLGEFVGEELYADKEINHMGYMGVGQKLKNGKVRTEITILPDSDTETVKNDILELKSIKK